MTDRALWCELLAVLAIGVFPYISGAITIAVAPEPYPHYWLFAFHLGSRSACVTFAVLYLIHRSGEPWSDFGMPAPRHSDLWLGLFVFSLWTLLWMALAGLLLQDAVGQDDLFAQPKGSTDYLLMVVAEALNCFSEELVTRAYLLTRLERLLKSRPQAVALSALLFASYHLYYGLGGAIYMLVVGVVLGSLYLVVRRVWPLAIGHTVHNLFTYFQ